MNPPKSYSFPEFVKVKNYFENWQFTSEGRTFKASGFECNEKSYYEGSLDRSGIRFVEVITNSYASPNEYEMVGWKTITIESFEDFQWKLFVILDQRGLLDGELPQFIK